MEPASWNQVAINLVNHLAGHPELALVALTELIRTVGRARGNGKGWTLDDMRELAGAGIGVYTIVVLKMVIGGGFPFLGMLTYLLRVLR